MFDRADDALVGATATDVAVHSSHNLVIGWIGGFLEERQRGHNHAGRAITALQGVCIEKSLLERMKPAVLLKAFDGGHRLLADGANRSMAGTSWDAIDENGASAALALAAPIFCAGEIEIIAQHAEKRALRICIDRARGSIDAKLGHVRHGLVFDGDRARLYFNYRNPTLLEMTAKSRIGYFEENDSGCREFGHHVTLHLTLSPWGVWGVRLLGLLLRACNEGI